MFVAGKAINKIKFIQGHSKTQNFFRAQTHDDRSIQAKALEMYFKNMMAEKNFKWKISWTNGGIEDEPRQE